MATIWTGNIDYGEYKNYCYIGNKKPSKYYVGGKQIKNIYLGNKWIFGDDTHSYTIYYSVNNGTTNSAENEITLNQKNVAFLGSNEIINVTAPISVRDNITTTYVTNDCTIRCNTYQQPPNYVTHNGTAKEYFMNINDDGRIDIGRMNWNMAIPINVSVELNSHTWSKLFTIKKLLAEYKIYLHFCFIMSKSIYDSFSNIISLTFPNLNYEVKFWETFPNKSPNNYQTINYSKSSFSTSELSLPPKNDFRYYIDSSLTTVYTIDKPNYNYVEIVPNLTGKITIKYGNTSNPSYVDYDLNTTANRWVFVTDEPISHPPGQQYNNLTNNFSQCKFVYDKHQLSTITNNWFDLISSRVHLYVVYSI